MKQELIIVKIGGNVIDKEADLVSFLAKFAAIPTPKILVHGGGKLATELSKKLNIEPLLIDGRRITDAETLKIVTMVYAGLVNKNIVAQLQAMQCNAIGLSGADANAIKATKRNKGDIDYGFVGDVLPENVQIELFANLLNSGYMPIVAPITHDGTGQLLNTNADTIASALAKALSQLYAIKLIYCFEKAGVLADANDDNSVIHSIDTIKFAELKAAGIVSGGMLPKLDNAFDALNAGVQQVIIGKAQSVQHLATSQNCGTVITK